MSLWPRSYLRGRCAWLLAAAALWTLLSPPWARAQDKVLFEKDVLPIFHKQCLKCHGEGKLKGGLDLRRRFTMLEGGENGPTIVLGHPDKSVLIQRLVKGEMPPPKDGKLDPRELEIIRRWVAGGALLANDKEAPLPAQKPQPQFTAEDRSFWAFVPPKRPEVPRVKAAERVRNSIDAFLLHRLEAKGLSFTPEASRETLLRRLTLDLHGLPPTPAQRDEFLKDDRPDAYERLVDKLLAAPEYGERWGRHWLDLAGYADSDGYLAADRLRPEAWRYRDYVINALNDDMPFDQFLTEQLAGDELSDWRRADKLTPDMIRQLTATGFLRTALDPTYPGYTEPNEIHQVMADTMQIVGTTFMGLTVHCARCHDHKLDPISHRDYYSLQTVFLPALDPGRWQPSEVRGIRQATEKELAEIQAHNRKVDEALKPLQAELAKITPKLDKGKEPPPEAKAVVERLKAEIAKEQAKKKPVPPLLRGVSDLEGKCPDGRILRRGDHDKPGPVVQAGVPEVLAPAGFRLSAEPGHKTSGRRLALAKWLTDPANPLTARVQVNHLWQRHFGKGLVATPANFGRSGAKPSHPELLDWLAWEFMDPTRPPGELRKHSWSLKHMHRLMVTSTAYRQASTSDPARLAADPKNVLLGYWRPQRLQGEVVRDSILAVSGKLNPKRFGPAAPVVMHGDGSVDTRDDAEGNRRSVYVIVRRSQHMTLLDLFDTPMMEVNCPERNISTVPLQALALLHAPVTHANAAALADRILKTAPADAKGRIALAFQLAFTRDPRPREGQLIEDFLAKSIAETLKDQKSPADAQRIAAERIAAERTAWTQVALVLFNSNEFVYAP